MFSIGTTKILPLCPLVPSKLVSVVAVLIDFRVCHEICFSIPRTIIVQKGEGLPPPSPLWNQLSARDSWNLIRVERTTEDTGYRATIHKTTRFAGLFFAENKRLVWQSVIVTLQSFPKSDTVTAEYCNALLSFSHTFLFGQERRRRRPPKFKIADSWKEIYSRMLYSIIRKIWTFFLVLSVHLKYTRGHRCCITEF